MKKESYDQIDEAPSTVVTFPTSLEDRLLDDDPLEQLLNEFSDITDDFDFDDEEAQAAHESLCGQNYQVECLEKKDLHSLGEAELLMAVNEQLEKLSEASERLSYYLNEVKSATNHI